MTLTHASPVLSLGDEPPPDVRADLDALRDALDQQIPPKILDRNLLIATRAHGIDASNEDQAPAAIQEAVAEGKGVSTHVRPYWWGRWGPHEPRW